MSLSTRVGMGFNGIVLFDLTRSPHGSLGSSGLRFVMIRKVGKRAGAVSVKHAKQGICRRIDSGVTVDVSSSCVGTVVALCCGCVPMWLKCW